MNRAQSARTCKGSARPVVHMRNGKRVLGRSSELHRHSCKSTNPVNGASSTNTGAMPRTKAWHFAPARCEPRSRPRSRPNTVCNNKGGVRYEMPNLGEADPLFDFGASWRAQMPEVGSPARWGRGGHRRAAHLSAAALATPPLLETVGRAPATFNMRPSGTSSVKPGAHRHRHCPSKPTGALGLARLDMAGFPRTHGIATFG